MFMLFDYLHLIERLIKLERGQSGYTLIMLLTSTCDAYFETRNHKKCNEDIKKMHILAVFKAERIEKVGIRIILEVPTNYYFELNRFTIISTILYIVSSLHYKSIVINKFSPSSSTLIYILFIICHYLLSKK